MEPHRHSGTFSSSKMRHRSLSDTQGYFLIKNALPQPLRYSGTFFCSKMRYRSLSHTQGYFFVQKCATTASQTVRNIFWFKNAHGQPLRHSGIFFVQKCATAASQTLRDFVWLKNVLTQPLRHSDTAVDTELCHRGLLDTQGYFKTSQMCCRSLICSCLQAYLLELTSRAYCLCYSGNDPTYRIRKSRLSEFEHFDGGHKMASPLRTKDCQASG